MSRMSPILPIPRQRPAVQPQPDPTFHQRRREVMKEMDLTEREVQCVIGASKGMTNSEIGQQLFVGEQTVKTHMRSLFKKLGARDRAHAVALAFQVGVLR